MDSGAGACLGRRKKDADLTAPDPLHPHADTPSDAEADTPAGPPATALRRALRVLADPWTMLILKEIFNGTRRFAVMQRALNIPKQTLSLRLTTLCHEQMLYRRFVGPGQGVLEYAPTAKTYDLSDAMYAIWLWHQANPNDADILPFDIVHKGCGHVLGAQYCCSACGEPATGASVTVERSQPEQFESGPRPRLARRNDASFTAAAPQAGGMVAASLVGDLPCNEILYLLFQGPRHMLAIAGELGLGPNVGARPAGQAARAGPDPGRSAGAQAALFRAAARRGVLSAASGDCRMGRPLVQRRPAPARSAPPCLWRDPARALPLRSLRGMAGARVAGHSPETEYITTGSCVSNLE